MSHLHPPLPPVLWLKYAPWYCLPAIVLCDSVWDTFLVSTFTEPWAVYEHWIFFFSIHTHWTNSCVDICWIWQNVYMIRINECTFNHLKRGQMNPSLSVFTTTMVTNRTNQSGWSSFRFKARQLEILWARGREVRADEGAQEEKNKHRSGFLSKIKFPPSTSVLRHWSFMTTSLLWQDFSKRTLKRSRVYHDTLFYLTERQEFYILLHFTSNPSYLRREKETLRFSWWFPFLISSFSSSLLLILLI